MIVDLHFHTRCLHVYKFENQSPIVCKKSNQNTNSLNTEHEIAFQCSQKVIHTYNLPERPKLATAVIFVLENLFGREREINTASDQPSNI